MASSSAYPPRAAETPHLSSVASTPSLARHRHGLVHEHQKQVEEESRRFDDFETIDWLQDTLNERRHRQTQLPSSNSHRGAFIASIYRILDTAQSWGVVSLVGACIGLNAAVMAIITAWLSDLKLGYCKEGWWLNRKFCCWEMVEELSESGICDDWQPWTQWVIIQWAFYVAFAGLFAWTGAFIVRSFAPFAAGSGISEIKVGLAGFRMAGFMSAATLLIKSITLPIAIASGLSVGKEGPSVHVACSIGSVVAGMFYRFSRSQAKMREIVTAASAAGVATAFGSPIGGVLFALEEMTVNFPIKTMWRSFFCALVATVTLSAMNPYRTGKLVLFQVHFDRDWHFFELGFFILIGVFGGLYGAFVIKYNFQIQAFRRKHLAKNGVAEAVFLALLTAVVCYTNKFLKIDMNESLDILFRECEGGGDYENLCQTWAQWRMVNSLLLATVLRTCLVIISYGCKVPAGIFVPSMAVGATFGRMVGILVKALYRAHPDSSMFAACDPEKPCITPGTYAFLGAAAGLAGITRITVTVVVIMFELTGALTYILPTMIVVMVTKAVSDQFGSGGIADQVIKFNGFPFLENEDHAFNVPVSSVMTSEVIVLPSEGMRLPELEQLLETSSYKGFPIVKSRTDMTLLGDISRADLLRAIQTAQDTHLVDLDAHCLFGPDPPTTPGLAQGEYATNAGPSRRGSLPPHEQDEFADADENSIDFSPYVNLTPLTASPKQPLEFVGQMFKRIGPRAILVEQEGRLCGLVTVKDFLRYTIAHEAEEHAARSTEVAGMEGGMELEEVLEDLREWGREVREAVWRWVTGGQEGEGGRSR